MTDEKEMTQEEQQQWVREQYLVATKYLADKGLVTESVKVEDSRYIVPIFSVWKVTLFDKSKVWVICGDLPSDHSNESVAPNAREAIRHFALKWQMQAENLLRADTEDQNQFAHLLIGRSEGLYKMCEDEKLWGEVS
jgi:hypothetical protein